MSSSSPNEEPLLPPGAWDCHHHIFDPLVPTYNTFKENHNIAHSVLTPGLSYGSDIISLLSFLSSLNTTSPISNSTRAIAVLSDEMTPQDLQNLHTLGIRGIRLNLYAHNATHDVDKQITLLIAAAPRIKPLNWCLNFLPQAATNWSALEPIIPSLGLNVVTDHFAVLKGGSMLDIPNPSACDGTTAAELSAVKAQPGLSTVVSLLKSGHLWIKLSAPYRASDLAPHYPDLKPLVRILVDANPERVLWGSDWPHTPRLKIRSREEALRETPYLEVDDGAWLRALRGWLTEEEWDNVMVRNPGVLYGW